MHEPGTTKTTFSGGFSMKLGGAKGQPKGTAAKKTAFSAPPKESQLHANVPDVFEAADSPSSAAASASKGAGMTKPGKKVASSVPKEVRLQRIREEMEARDKKLEADIQRMRSEGAFEYERKSADSGQSQEAEDKADSVEGSDDEGSRSAAVAGRGALTAHQDVSKPGLVILSHVKDLGREKARYVDRLQEAAEERAEEKIITEQKMLQREREEALARGEKEGDVFVSRSYMAQRERQSQRRADLEAEAKLEDDPTSRKRDLAGLFGSFLDDATKRKKT